MVRVINTTYGDLGETYGVPVSEIQEGIKNGVRKVNIDTDLRMAATGSIRKFLHENPKEFDPRKYNKVAKDAMKEFAKLGLKHLVQLEMLVNLSEFLLRIWPLNMQMASLIIGRNLSGYFLCYLLAFCMIYYF